jgi:hypothetical protein
VHAVVALALPAVEAFDLAIPAQVFADPGLPRRYEFTVCAPAAGLVRSTALPIPGDLFPAVMSSTFPVSRYAFP